MKTEHSPLSLGGHTLHQIEFDPATFTDADLLWLPHHARLMPAGKKRKAEHLAGRLAAFYALQQHGIRAMPDIGDNRQPLWPNGWYGSISHSGTTALAVVSREPVGVDLETVLSADVCAEIAESIISPEESERLKSSGHPFPLALTLAFSAKESVYKAYSFATHAMPGFMSARVVAMRGQDISLQLTDGFSPALAGKICHVVWLRNDNQLVTLLAKTLQSA
ncbi:enterobactin synthase subunit EntD [Scandinavium goeteborgense]|uniref:Enterobactin synthase component D n=1 Tax=Scandinavium goeteborgense TaxID=1851514 RepID=A0A4V3BNB1_SCAGO|nr:enterobactin synthase subunit EntD [Scandinavium goeteborgense]TDN53942.1 enterobactin synthetase component D [Scandinavium goeteborgense]